MADDIRDPVEPVHAGYDAWPRWVSLVLGVWLFISSWVWPHTMASHTNTWVLGALITLASAWAMFAPPVRYLNTLFSVWLFFSTLVLYHAVPGTLWNNLIIAIIVFVMSLIPSTVTTMRPHGGEPIHAS